jgi:hypothetical protein
MIIPPGEAFLQPGRALHSSVTAITVVLDAGGARMADTQSSFLKTQPHSPATLRTSGAGESWRAFIFSSLSVLCGELYSQYLVAYARSRRLAR